jgi:hypothetical protein
MFPCRITYFNGWLVPKLADYIFLMNGRYPELCIRRANPKALMPCVVPFIPRCPFPIRNNTFISAFYTFPTNLIVFSKNLCMAKYKLKNSIGRLAIAAFTDDDYSQTT